MEKENLLANARTFAAALLKIGAVQLRPEQPFTWASGWKSPIYCDNRVVLSYPEIRTQVISGLVDLTRTLPPFDVIAGVATAGIPHGALLADRLQLPFAYVRAQAKSHGRQNLIEGRIEKGQRVLVVEDLISTGGSSLQAVHALREAGCEVAALAALFTYGFPQADIAFREAGCAFSTLSRYEILVEEALKTGYIKKEHQELLSRWRENPAVWGSV